MLTEYWEIHLLIITWIVRNVKCKFPVLINAGNYPGVGDKPGTACAKGDRNGKVISLITKRNYSEVEAALGLSHSVDVTGGMKKKVEEFIAISSLGIDCWIIDGNLLDNLVQVFLEKTTSGTLIQAY